MRPTYRTRARLSSIAVLALGCLIPALQARADVPLGEKERIVVFADFRTRLESDWNSTRGDGTKRDDRTRLRVRARLGGNFHITDDLLIQLRIASGSVDNQQSTNITIVDFNGNDTGDSDFNFDRYFLQKSFGGGHAWVGKNALPMWRQNGIFRDGDTPVAGLGFDYKLSLDRSSLTFNTGYFSLPVGMRDFAGNLGLGQAVYETNAGGVDLTFAGGVLLFDADPDDPDSARLLQDNGSRDYTVWVASGQSRFDAAGKPLEIGIDYLHNSENYDSIGVDPLTALHRDETDGWHVQLIWGETKAKGDWLVSLSYAHIELFAVNNSYSQDDSVRWGADNQARVSNFKGSELRYAVGLGKRQTLMARLFFVDALRLLEPGDTHKEDGNRFRIDYTVRL
jgi:hypothetical protein